MEKLWHTEFQKTGLSCTASDYYNIDFPAAKEIFKIPSLPTTNRIVIDEKTVGIESICAGVAMYINKHKDIGFCSDVPNAKCVIESKFFIVSANDVKTIQDNLQSESATEEPPRKSKFFQFGSSKQEETTDKERNFFNNIKQSWTNTPRKKKVVIGGLGVLALAVGEIIIHFISGTKD